MQGESGFSGGKCLRRRWGGGGGALQEDDHEECWHRNDAAFPLSCRNHRVACSLASENDAYSGTASEGQMVAFEL